MLFFLLFINTVFSFNCSTLKKEGVYTVEEAFECMNEKKYDYEFVSKIVKEVQQEINGYIYKDILKNPPQPEFDSNYFNVADLDEKFNQINLNQTSLYDIYRDMFEAIANANDLHFSLSLYSGYNGNNYYIDSFYYALPFDITITDDQKIYLPIKQTNYKITIDQMLKDNVEVAVKSINGISPVEFIRDFGKRYGRLKSVHGNFVRAQSILTFSLLSDLPLPREVLETPLKIEWENGKTLTVKYEMIYNPTFTVYLQTNEERDRAIEERMNKKNYAPITINDINDISKRNYKRTFITENENYDYITNDGCYACKTNYEKGMNVFVMKGFNYDYGNPENCNTVITKCVEQFDNNTYPITIIMANNGGGGADILYTLLKIFAPKIDLTMIGSVRISDEAKGVFENEYYKWARDTEKCEYRYNPETKEYNEPFFEVPETVMYGNVEHKKTKESLFTAPYLIDAKFVKNVRKPTDMIIYTDGFCYSACSIFTKLLKEVGSGIFVGFAGDPKEDNQHFDVGQSPSDLVEAYTIGSEQSKKLREFGIALRFTYFETYRLNYQMTETLPREYLIDPIDVRSSILQFKDNKLNEFIDEALQIRDEYQTKCNADNERLVYETEECYHFDHDKHAHGGYKCSAEGKWTKECVPSYCDNGYVFDYINQKCILDVCNPPENIDSEESNENDEIDEELIGIIIGIISFLILILFIIIISLVIFIICKRKSRTLHHNTNEQTTLLASSNN